LRQMLLLRRSMEKGTNFVLGTLKFPPKAARNTSRKIYRNAKF
jgi:hypothetical protein